MNARWLVSIPFLLAFQSAQEKWEDTFSVDKNDFSSVGSNPYFSLVPGTKLEYEGGDTRLVVTVLDRTKAVDGVQTRIIEEREYEDGKVIEVSRNFFAIDTKTNDVYYFGEEVDLYKDGKLVGHEGAWLAGKESAKFGLMMPGKPTVGRMHYQEIAPNVAMDRAKIVDLKARVVTPAGTFENCIKVEETTPLEPDAKEYKFYAPGIGLVQDAEVKLVKNPS